MHLVWEPDFSGCYYFDQLVEDVNNLEFWIPFDLYGHVPKECTTFTQPENELCNQQNLQIRFNNKFQVK